MGADAMKITVVGAILIVAVLTASVVVFLAMNGRGGSQLDAVVLTRDKP